MASGANNTFRQVGIATGIAVLGAVFQAQIVAHTTAVLSKSPYGPEVLRRGGAQLQGALSSGEVRAAAAAIPIAGARDALLQAYHSGFSLTLNHLMEIGAVVALVGAVCGFALVRQRDFVIPGGPPAGGQPGGAAERRPEPRATSASPPSMLERFALEGPRVRLEPLTEGHIPALVEAAAIDRTNFDWTYTPDGPEQMTEYVRDALVKVASGAHVAFATVRRGRDRADPTWWSGPPASARSPSGSGPPVRATSAMACPMWSTSASPGWRDRPSGPRSTRRRSSS